MGKAQEQIGYESIDALVEDAKTVLVVDDEEHVRFRYREEFHDAGYKVITYDSGYKLLELIEEEQPDVVILDVKMPQYDGLDLLNDIRDRWRSLPVILNTAYDQFKEDMKSIPADFYVIKSFDLTELMKKTAMALEASEERKVYD